MTKGEVKRGLWGEREGKYWYSQSSCWYNIPSPRRWTVWALTWIMPVGLTAAAVALGAMENPKKAFSTFGKAAVVYELPSGMSRSGLAIVAALPQLLLGLLYLSSNALLTLFFLSHEFSQFSSQLLPFRISSGEPLGAQTTSLYLTLPRPLSWMLFFLITAMAYLLSQGVLLVSVDGSQGSTPLAIGTVWGSTPVASRLPTGSHTGPRHPGSQAHATRRDSLAGGTIPQAAQACGDVGTCSRAQRASCEASRKPKCVCEPVERLVAHDRGPWESP